MPGPTRRRAPTVPAAVRVDGVSKVVRPRATSASVALDRITLDVAAGEFVCLVGASGCGKSTLLNLVAGLDQPPPGRSTVARPATP